MEQSEVRENILQMSQQSNPSDVVAPLENGTNSISESLPQRWYRLDDFLAMGLGALIIVVAAAGGLSLSVLEE